MASSSKVLVGLDDYPVHQVAKPIAVPATSDRNAYGRYWFGAAHREGAFQVEAAFGRYANLGVVDGHVSISKGGHQTSFHVSGRAPADPMDTSVGPLRLEVVEPLKTLRLVVEPNTTGVAADLTWHARTGALLEDHTVMEDGTHVMVDMDRFLQFGQWEGTVEVDGEVTELRRDEVVGVRDRSWGVRPVGTQPPGRPSQRVPRAWLWAPIHFDDTCRVVGWFEEPGGAHWRPDGHVIPVLDPVPPSVAMGDEGVERLDPQQIRLEFQSGSRWATGAEIDVRFADGSTGTMELEPLLRFHMLGLGYTSPAWGHGVWHGELELGREDWDLDAVAPLDPTHQHVHHLVKVRLGDEEGVGIFEQILFGPHTQWGFSDILDGAP
jgi:hypothetical protein